jgi:hypothetical protein
MTYLPHRPWSPNLPDPLVLSASEVSNPVAPPTIEDEEKTQGYKDRAEYRSLAHTLRITPVGAVRSSTQNRLIEILEALGK